MNLQGLGAMLESLSAKKTTSRREGPSDSFNERAIFLDTIVKTMPYPVKTMAFAIKNGCCFEKIELFLLVLGATGGRCFSGKVALVPRTCHKSAEL